MQQLQLADMLWHALAIFLLIGALAGMLVSVLLIFKPHVIERINQVANHWISTRHMEQLMNRSFKIERWVYRNHRLTGLVITLGAGYMLTYFGWFFNRTTALQSLSRYVANRVLLDGLLQSLVWAMLICGAVALLTGVFMLLRPSLLRGVEDKANQWVSAQGVSQMMDLPRDQVNNFVERHAHRVGWVLLVGSIYLFFVTFRWLL